MVFMRNAMTTCVIDKSSSRRGELVCSIITWPPFFQYNKRLLRQNTGGAYLYIPQDCHWLASFEVIPPQTS